VMTRQLGRRAESIIAIAIPLIPTVARVNPRQHLADYANWPLVEAAKSIA